MDEEGLLVLAIALALFVVLYLRLRRLEARMSALDGRLPAEAPNVPSLSLRLRRLEARVSALDEGLPAEAPAAPPLSDAAVAPAVRSEAVPRPPEPAVSRPSVERPTAPAAPEPPRPPRPPAAVAAAARERAAPRRGLDIESLLGARWFARIGAAVFVLGLVLFAGYQVNRLGPTGKAAAAFAAAFAMIGVGTWLERREPYRSYARTLAAAGWALLYFWTYAIHGIDALRIVGSPALALVLLLAVSAGFVAWSFRYRSEWVTIFGFGLAYLAVALSEAGVSSFLAAAVLAASLVALGARARWYYLPLAGALACYVSGALWLFPSVKGAAAEALLASPAVGILFFSFCWVAFTAGGFFMRPTSEDENVLVGVTQGNNTVAAAGLVYALLAPAGAASLSILAFAIAATAVAAGARAWKRDPVFRVDATLGYGLLLLAATLGLHGKWITLAWLAVSLLWLAAGCALKERILRGLPLLGFAAAAFRLLQVDIAFPGVRRVLGLEVPTLLVCLAAGTASFFAARALLGRALRTEPSTSAERKVAHAYGWVAALLLAFTLWFAVPSPKLWVASTWIVAAVVFLEVGLRRGDVHLRLQGIALGAAAAFELAAFGGLPYGGRALPAAGAAVSLAALLLGWWWTGFRYRHRARLEEPLPEAAFWPATFFVATATLAWVAAVAVRPFLLGPAWGFLALALLESGMRLPERWLRWPAHLLMAAGLVACLSVDLTLEGAAAAGLSYRLLTVGLMVAYLAYVHVRMRKATPEETDGRWAAPLAWAYSWAAAALLATLLFFELDRMWVAPAWAVLGLALATPGLVLREPHFRLQCYALALAAAFRTIVVNLMFVETVRGWNLPVLTAALVAGTLAASYVAWVVARGKGILDGTALPARIRQVDRVAVPFFLGALLVVLGFLIYKKASGNLLTVLWSLEGLGALGAGFALRERGARLAGLGILSLCILKVFFLDLAGMEPAYRILSFVVLGAVLLLVSFLYARYREILKRFL